MATREDIDGRQTFFGPGRTQNEFGGDIAKHGAFTEVKYLINFDSLPAAEENNDMFTIIPAGAVIDAAYLKVIEAFTGATDLDFGLVEPDGTAIDPDGLVAAAPIAAGNTIIGAGALIGTVIAEDAMLIADAANATAGKAELIVRYLAQ